MIPGLREAKRLKNDLAMISEGNILGLPGVLMVAFSIYRQISSMINQQQQAQEDYRRQIIEAQNFATTEQFSAWQNSQRQAFDSYRSGIVP